MVIFMCFFFFFVVSCLETLGGDSGFTELSDGSKSVSTTPDLNHLNSTPSRTDSTSDDTGCP